MSYIAKQDKVIVEAIEREFQRQNSNIELVVPENFVSEVIMEAQGSVLTNKYAEGYPGCRYYGGCGSVDATENIAINRARALFRAEHANIQPRSGSQANMTAYLVASEMGDTVLDMNLSHGGHLTHEAPVNFSGKFYNFVEYGTDKDTERINCDGVRRLAPEHKPELIMAGALTYSRTIDFKKFREIADEVNVKLMVDTAHIAELVTAGLHPNPVEYADFVATTIHKTLRGPRDGMILCKGKYKEGVDKTISPGTQDEPFGHVVAAKAVAFEEALEDNLKTYQRQVAESVEVLAEALVNEGSGIVSGGADNHLVAVDVKGPIGLIGKEVEETLDSVGIICNKNTAPFDQEKPLVASSIHLGIPVVMTRGFDKEVFEEVAKIISLVLKNSKDKEKLQRARERIAKLAVEYPLHR